MNTVCISASNMARSGGQSVSLQICRKIADTVERGRSSCEILDLRDFPLAPCVGCGGCFDSRRCCQDAAFNGIYDKLAAADALFIVAPHYAPIPAKLCMLLEKMEEITFLHWWKDNAYQSELYRLPTGIISHGGGGDWALKSYKAMVNDTIANALETIQCAVVPYDGEWNTGISLPVSAVQEGDPVFPLQEYDWGSVDMNIQKYVELVLERACTRK